MITVKAPGKLYIAGEYAVVEPGNPAILIAVNQFIKITAKLAHNHGTISSDQSPSTIVNWTNQDHHIKIANHHHQFNYVFTAIKVVEQYIAELHLAPLNYQLAITSQLDSKDGQKYGLGSSAAVTVAVVKAVFKLYGLKPSLLTIFKLAAIAHLKVQGNGSLGDVAASVFQGWIAYQSFDRKWLMDQLTHSTIKATVDMYWQQLKIKPLVPPKELELIVGWTGSPASTANLVGKVAENKQQANHAYKQFLQQSSKCIHTLIHAFQHQDLIGIKKQINQNRHLLQSLATNTNVNIETPLLNQMCTIAIKNGGAAKSSGAGGGDCGIAILDSKVDRTDLINDWKSKGIQTLNFKISYQEEFNDQPSLTPQK